MRRGQYRQTLPGAIGGVLGLIVAALGSFGSRFQGFSILAARPARIQVQRWSASTAEHWSPSKAALQSYDVSHGWRRRQGRSCSAGASIAALALTLAFSHSLRLSHRRRAALAGRYQPFVRMAKSSLFAKQGAEEDAPSSVDAAMEQEDEADELEDGESTAPERWSCSSCGSPNFPGDNECHKCGAPRPSSIELELVEERRLAQEEADEALDAFMRLQAELQNYRRSHGQSMSRAKEVGKREALRQLVPVTTDIEQALEPPADVTGREAKLFDSYALLFKKVLAVWDKLAVERLVVEVGDQFDERRHREVASREAGDEAPGTILEVLDSGWIYGDNVLIPSSVVVSASPQLEEAAEDQDEAEGDDETCDQEGDEELREHGGAAERSEDIADEWADPGSEDPLRDDDS